jgi:hypothetical protein
MSDSYTSPVPPEVASSLVEHEGQVAVINDWPHRIDSIDPDPDDPDGNWRLSATRLFVCADGPDEGSAYPRPPANSQFWAIVQPDNTYALYYPDPAKPYTLKLDQIVPASALTWARRKEDPDEPSAEQARSVH